MRSARIALAFIGLFGPLVCMADGVIYSFVDSRGEIHLSNDPDDARYAELYAPAMPAAPVPDVPLRPLDQRPAGPFAALIAQAAGRYGVEALLHAVIRVESSYNPRAVSKSGAAGLMQLMPETARRYGVVDVFDPTENVRAGAQYLSDLLKLFGNDVNLALAAYNAGEAAVLKYGRSIPPYRETSAYVPKVVDFYQRWRAAM